MRLLSVILDGAACRLPAVDLAEHDVERADLIASNIGTLTTAFDLAIPAQARDAFLEPGGGWPMS